MNIGVKAVEKVAYNPWFAVFSGLASICGLLWVAYDKIILGTIDKNALILFLISLAFLSITLLFSIKLRIENRALQKFYSTFHSVNHLYRDELRKVFHEDSAISNRQDLLAIEKEVLSAVCQRIRNGFSELLGGRDIMMTIKLIIPSESEGKMALTYVRSVEKSERDETDQMKYIVGTGKNTAFDEALKITQHSPSHYYSANLPKESNYSNERQGYEHFYRSTIVVPIRAKVKKGKSYTTDDIGFLTIDTKSINRLNGGYHVQIMNAFADQIYNFMSLMRGNYLVIVDGESKGDVN